MVSSRAICQLVKNLIVTSTYWYCKGFCCHKRDDVIEVTGEAAWLFIAACVFWLSPRDLMPEFLNVCDGIRPLYNIVAVIAYAHIMFCYVWVEFLTALSVVFCYIDKTAKRAGFPILTDNALFTLKPGGGYFNLFSVLAFTLWLATTVMWLNTCEFEDGFQWRCSTECDMTHSERAASRALGACYGNGCGSGSDDDNETGPECDGNNTDNLSDLEFLLEQERAARH